MRIPASCCGVVGFSTLRGAVRNDGVLPLTWSLDIVAASALDALQHGFVPCVVREACGDREARPQEAKRFDLQAKFAEVVGETRAIELLTRR